MPTGGFKITQPKGNYVGLISNSTGSGTATSADIEVLDEGISLTATVASVDFVGAGVTATATGDAVTVTIPGSSAGVLPFLFATDYGAVADNSTNNDAALAAWVAAGIALGGAIMVLPVGTCKITVPLVIAPSSPCQLEFLGAGEMVTGSRIRQATANTSGLVFNTNAQFSMLRHMWIEGVAGGTSSIGVSGDVSSIGLRVRHFWRGLSLPSTSYYSKHYNSWFHTNENAQVFVTSGANNCDFTACFVNGDGLGAYGYDIGGCLSPKIIGGSVEGCLTAGIRANGGTNAAGLAIDNVYFEQVDGVTDILLGDSTIIRGTTISGTTHVKSSYSGTGWAIHAVRADGLSINGGEIDSSDAIWVETYPAVITLPELRNAGTLTLVAGTIVLDPAITTNASPVGTAAHGSSPYLAPIDHGHALGGTVAGDLSGTLPNPTVAKINGVAVTGTPAVGYLLTATSSTAAAWQAPAASGSHILLADAHATPFVFEDLLQMDDGSDFMWTDP